MLNVTVFFRFQRSRFSVKKRGSFESSTKLDAPLQRVRVSQEVDCAGRGSQVGRGREVSAY